MFLLYYSNIISRRHGDLLAPVLSNILSSVLTGATPTRRSVSTGANIASSVLTGATPTRGSVSTGAKCYYFLLAPVLSNIFLVFYLVLPRHGDLLAPGVK